MQISNSAVMVIVTALSLAGFSTTVRARHDPMEALRWMAGCLEMRSKDRLVEEHRMDVRGGSMLGMARTTTPRGLGEYELTLIREKGGKIVFEAHPSGQPSAEFTAAVVGSDSVIFSAPQHDYPQMVGYRRSGPDSIVAWTDGMVKGKSKRVELRYRRVSCPGQNRGGF
jgi:hypothetical protein